MAITDINISEQLQTGAPSIKYTGNEGPQPSQQHQQEMMIAQQIWEALSPEQQGQFQNFEQFFASGVWKQILQQMQADEGQGPGPQPGPEPQGIAGLGPRNMEQQMPTPNRMGAQYGGRMGFRYGKTYGSKMESNDMSAIERNINYLMSEHGLSREEAIERVLSSFRRSEMPSRPFEFSEDMIADMKSRVYPSQIKDKGERIAEPFYPDRFEGERIAEPFYPDRFEGRLEPMETEEIGIESLRGRR